MEFYAYIILACLLLAGLVCRAVTIWGAARMLQGKSYGMGVTSSVLAMIPCSPLWLISLPMGLWSLSVLTRRDVKAGFGTAGDREADEDQSPATSDDGQRIVQVPADALILVAGAALLTGIGVAVWLWQAPTGWDPTARRSFAQGHIQFTLIGMSITHVIYAAFMATAGFLMRRLRVRLFVLLCVVLVGVLLPATLALNVIMELEHIPVWPVVIPMWLGVPFAIWAAVVLFRQDVREAFTRQTEASDVDEGSSATAGKPSTIRRAFADWWTERDRWFTNAAKAVLIVLYIIGLWGFFTMHGAGRAEEFRHTIGFPTPWFVIEKDPDGFRWHITLSSWAWLIALAAYACYYAWYRIRLAEGSKISRLETPQAQVVFWGVIAIGAITLAMSPLFFSS